MPLTEAEASEGADFAGALIKRLPMKTTQPAGEPVMAASSHDTISERKSLYSAYINLQASSYELVFLNEIFRKVKIMMNFQKKVYNKGIYRR